MLHPDHRRGLDDRAGALELTRRGGVGGFCASALHGRGNTPAILTADGSIPTDRHGMEDELVASGRFVRIETRGARSGLERAVTVGFVDDDITSSAILVAATAPDAAWALNLLADPACHVRVGNRSFDAVAEPLERAEHARAVRDMILRYGTPAEGLGRGPSFRLRPVGEAAK